MEQKNGLYLVVLSILLSVSVLKLTEVFQLGGQLKDVFLSLKTGGGLSVTVVSVYLFVAGYLIFFVLVALASYGIVRQLGSKSEAANHPDLGPLVGMCVAVLAVAYLMVFSVVIYGIVGR